MRFPGDFFSALAVLASPGATLSFGQTFNDFDLAPHNYYSNERADPMSRLIDKAEAGEYDFGTETGLPLLPKLLSDLEIPGSSQVAWMPGGKPSRLRSRNTDLSKSPQLHAPDPHLSGRSSQDEESRLPKAFFDSHSRHASRRIRILRRWGARANRFDSQNDAPRLCENFFIEEGGAKIICISRRVLSSQSTQTNPIQKQNPS